MTDPTSIDPLAAAAGVIIEHINDDHADALLLVARVLGHAPSAVRARAVGIDRRGIDLLVDEEAHPFRIAFAEPALDLAAAQVQMLALVATARAHTDVTELTALERRAGERAHIRTFIAAVTKVERIGPSMIQVTCGGGDLSTYEPIGPDDFVYVLAPRAGRTVLPIDRSFTWSAYEQMPVAERPVGAYYTVRRWRADAVELDLVVVTHGDDGEGSRWARRVRAGDQVALWGPRRIFDPPASTTRLLLVGDETGVHAIAAILETLPPDAIVDVVVEADHPREDVALVTGPNVTITRRYRHGAAPGTTPLLLDAVQARPRPEPGTYAWGGAESRTMTAIRRYLRDECGLTQDAVAMTAYWRRR